MSETSAGATDRDDAAGIPERLRLFFDLDVDICVVGAGLAGLTGALEAARVGGSVAVLEGREVGWESLRHPPGHGHAGLWTADRRTDRAHRIRRHPRIVGAVERGRRVRPRHRNR